MFAANMIGPSGRVLGPHCTSKLQKADNARPGSDLLSTIRCLISDQATFCLSILSLETRQNPTWELLKIRSFVLFIRLYFVRFTAPLFNRYFLALYYKYELSKVNMRYGKSMIMSFYNLLLFLLLLLYSSCGFVLLCLPDKF